LIVVKLSLLIFLFLASSKLPIYSALAADLLIAVTKFIAAGVTGSSAMMSEGIHSVVDSCNQLLLLLGIRRSKKQPDEKRPFGYGKELYFWSFVVSILIFGVGGGISFYEGITHIQHPEPIVNPLWNYIVLGAALLFEGISLVIALTNFNKRRGEVPFWSAVKRSKDPTSFVVLFEDATDVLGLLVAATGVYVGHRFNMPAIDGIASIIIGLVLTAVSLVLTRESRSLLMGETASTQVLKEIVTITKADPAIIDVRPPLSMYLGPEEVILVLQLSFRDDLSAPAIVQASERIKQAIRQKFSNFKQILIEPQPAGDNTRQERDER
jgi:cation diffusion facilitator family transporter